MNPKSAIYFSYYHPDADSLNTLRKNAEKYLCPEEMAQWWSFKVSKRQDEWLTSRSVTKLMIRAVPGFHHFELHNIKIMKKHSGHPYIMDLRSGQYLGSYSLSHSHGAVFCGFSIEPHLRFGFDLEKIEPRPLEFIQDYFTCAEIEMIRKNPDMQDEVATLVWSAKEAVLKAMQRGLSVDTRTVEIHPDLNGISQNGWHTCRVRAADEPEENFTVLWQSEAGFIRTICVENSLHTQLQELPINLVMPGI